ncbi:MAG: diiron oxygenase [Acidimicrobiales bacterium]
MSPGGPVSSGGAGEPVPGPAVNQVLVERLTESWPRRATIRTRDFETGCPSEYEPSVPDYPVALLPFAGHPTFLAASPAQRQAVLTGAWLVYNQRVISAEEEVANPALTAIMHGSFPGAEEPRLRQAVQQTLIDEHFHTYMHMLAVERTCDLRQAGAWPETPPSVTLRRFQAYRSRGASGWERNLAALAWTVVSEVSINAYLRLLSSDGSIQPLHKLVTRLHDLDESAHGRLMVEVAKSVYLHMGPEQRRAFVAALGPALDSFVAHDYSAWGTVVDHAGIQGAGEMIADCAHDPASGTLVRDFSGLARLAEELGVTDQLGFDFPAPASASVAG